MSRWVARREGKDNEKDDYNITLKYYISINIYISFKH